MFLEWVNELRLPTAGAVVTEIGSANSGTTIDVPGGSTVRLAWAAVTDVGHKRAGNQDSYLARVPIFAVADGMGGHSSGDLASSAVVTRLDETVTDDFVELDLIEAALSRASSDIDLMVDEKALGVGTTVTGAVLTLHEGKPSFGIFNIGDSRVYTFTRNTLTQITVDHSLVQEMVDSGTISKAQAAKHPDGNIITRAVGFGDTPAPDLTFVPLRPGMRLLACSDGLTGELDDRRIRLHLSAGLSTKETVDALVDAALAAGGRDNVTVVLVDVLAGGF